MKSVIVLRIAIHERWAVVEHLSESKFGMINVWSNNSPFCIDEEHDLYDIMEGLGNIIHAAL
jgi:hypothetical protein